MAGGDVFAKALIVEASMGKRKRKICVLTGTRAEYGLLRSLLEAVAGHRRLELRLVVTGMHLVPKFGNTVDDIIRDGWDISFRIPIYSGRDRRAELGGSLGKLVSELSGWLCREKIDHVVVLGDRIEAFGGALAALSAGVSLAHIHGGEIAPGDMDDRIRYAISSLANIHFAATAESRRRLIRFGQPGETIYQVGAIGLDHIYAFKRGAGRPARKLDAVTIKEQLGLSGEREMIIVVQHPCGFGADAEERHMRHLLAAVGGWQGLIIGPCSDPGHSGILRSIRGHMRGRDGSSGRRWKFLANLDRDRYLEALWAAEVLVGNSSSGILEANALGTAVVNVGPRQTDRQRNGNTIIDCSHNVRQIRDAVGLALASAGAGRVRPSRSFGAGKSAVSIAAILADIGIDRMFLTKRPK